MESNHSSARQLVPLCNNKTTLCLPSHVQWTIVSINCFSIILNIFHMVILSRIKSLRGKAYYAILQATSTADILYGVRTLGQTMCLGRQLMQRWNPAAIWSSYFGSCTTYVRLLTLSIACIDRFLAMYRPFKHKTSLFVRFIWLWISLTWIVGGVIMPCRDVFTDFHAMCMDIALAANHCIARKIDKSVCIGVYYIHSLVLTVTLSLVLKQIYNLNKRLPSYPPETLHRQRGTKMAAIYVILIVIVYFLCYSLFIIDWSIMLAKGGTENRLRVLGVVTNSCFGILNTLIYGWITKAYQRQVAGIFPCIRQCTASRKSNKTPVLPIEVTTCGSSTFT